MSASLVGKVGSGGYLKPQSTPVYLIGPRCVLYTNEKKMFELYYGFLGDPKINMSIPWRNDFFCRTHPKGRDRGSIWVQLAFAPLMNQKRRLVIPCKMIWFHLSMNSHVVPAHGGASVWEVKCITLLSLALRYDWLREIFHRILMHYLYKLIKEVADSDVTHLVYIC